MKKKIYLFTLLLLSGIYIVSCKHDIPKPDNNTVITDSNGCDPSVVYFENDVLPLITSGCAYSGCHDAATHKEGIILIDYATIMSHGEVKAGKPRDSDLYEVLLEPRSSDKSMPPPPKAEFTSAQKDLIKKWIEQGALNNRCNDCDTTTVAYSKQIKAILTSNCNSCHNASAANGNVVLDSYAEVKKHVDNKKLIGAINHQNGYKAMPPSGVKMSDCNLKTIQKWIDNGAPNN